MINELKTILQQQGTLERSKAKEQYMRNQFPFYGLTRSTAKELVKPFLKKSLDWDTTTIINTVHQLFQEEKRECVYIAIDLLTQHYQRFSYKEIQQLYPLIDINPWWDSVDALQKPFSLWIRKNPQYLREISYLWNNSDSIWQKRSAIIIQLWHKKLTDTVVLSNIILSNKYNKEFFIQKAIGWILREYSKTNKLWVREFINQHSDLSNLAKREGSKYLYQIILQT